MPRRILAGLLCLAFVALPIGCFGGGAEITESSYWTGLVHQENSLVASVLYVPYLALKVPIRIIDGIINPKPTTQATVPPAAHKIH